MKPQTVSAAAPCYKWPRQAPLFSARSPLAGGSDPFSRNQQSFRHCRPAANSQNETNPFLYAGPPAPPLCGRHCRLATKPHYETNPFLYARLRALPPRHDPHYETNPFSGTAGLPQFETHPGDLRRCLRDS